MPDYPLRKNGRTKAVYFDPRDPKTNGASCWRDTPVARPYTDLKEACKYPEDHRGRFASPDILRRVNRTRRNANPRLPELRFYAFVQHEGETVILKPGIWYKVINIGQCYGIDRNYIRPRDAGHFLQTDRTSTRCTCRDGKTKKRDETCLEVRQLQGDHTDEDDDTSDEPTPVASDEEKTTDEEDASDQDSVTKDERKYPMALESDHDTSLSDSPSVSTSEVDTSSE